MNIEKYLKNLYENVSDINKTNLGLSNALYTFIYNNEKYALRVLTNDNSIDHRLLERQIQVNIKQYNMDFLEVYYDELNNIRISKWIYGLKSFKNYHNDDKYEKVINRIKQFHSLNIDTNLKFDLIKKYNNILLNINNKLFDYEKYKKIIDDYQKLNQKLIISHNDIVDGNVLYTNEKCLLIDYEYASLNYEYFDLVSLLSENNIYDTDIRNNIYNLYFEKDINEQQLKDINVIELAQDLLWSAWANLEYEKTNNKTYLDIFKEKTTRIIQLY